MTSATQLFIVWASPAGSVYLRHTLGNILSFVKEKVSEKDIYLQIFLRLFTYALRVEMIASVSSRKNSR